MPPKRIQVKRQKGWRKPDDAVYVGRPTKWGNPYRVGKEASTRDEVVTMHADWFATLSADEQSALLDPLRGKDLACWCPLDGACHADTLLRLANAQD